MAGNTKTVLCFDCGKEFEVFISSNITIPKYRCDGCLQCRL